MLLSGLIFFPLLLAALVAVIPQPKLIRTVTIAGMLIEFVASLWLIKDFDIASHQVQFAERYQWLPDFGVSYFIGVDGLSLWLVILTTFLAPITVLASWNSIDKRVKSFHIAMLALETAMLGALVSLDCILFYVFWELMLIPMYLLVGVWGGEKRIYAAVKFFIFTMVGSVFMLVAIIALMFMAKEQTGVLTADLLELFKVTVPHSTTNWMNPQTLMFAAFALAFAIKVPMFPLHTWLPDAHVQAPTPGSVILAGVLLKMGTYGFLRFAIPLFPEATIEFTPLIMGLAVFGIIYGALVAMVQPDIKKLVAYSSVSHLGYVMLGLFALNAHGVAGGMYQMLNHGISTGALFLLVGMIYERTHSREISKYGGLAKALPLFSIAFFIVTLSSIAVPGTNGFVGEFLILLGAFEANHMAAYFAVTGVVLGAVYMLWMFKRVFFGQAGELVPDTGHDDHHGHGHAKPKHTSHAHPLFDLSLREVAVLAPMIVLIFWMGIRPGDFLKYSDASVEHFIKNKSAYTLTIHKSEFFKTEDLAKAEVNQ